MFRYLVIGISMFRIDFGAKVRQDDGSLKLILIELQKTWVETETLRFRQYLGTQYADPDNMQKNGSYAEYGIPMVTVYLLGHCVGNMEEPVVYVRHKAYNYDGKEETILWTQNETPDAKETFVIDGNISAYEGNALQDEAFACLLATRKHKSKFFAEGIKIMQEKHPDLHLSENLQCYQSSKGRNNRK